jgi:hypothetical protein
MPANSFSPLSAFVMITNPISALKDALPGRWCWHFFRGLGGLALVALLAVTWPIISFPCTCATLLNCGVPQPGDVASTGVVLRQGANARSDDEPAYPTLFRVTESFHGLDPGVAQTEKLPLVDRLCKVSLVKWEPCAEK